MTIMYQIGLVPAFLNGIYTSDFNFKSLSKKGDIGLGTINQLNGEMIALDGRFYSIDKNGVASEIADSIFTPYAVVSFFKPQHFYSIRDISSLSNLNQHLISLLDNTNIFYMIRIDGEFASLQLRSETCQCMGGVPIAELLEKNQVEFSIEKSKGTLVATFSPAYTKNMCITDFHYHYLNANKTTGGHVFDLKVVSAQISIQPIYRFQLELINIPKLKAMGLNIDTNHVLKNIE